MAVEILVRFTVRGGEITGAALNGPTKIVLLAGYRPERATSFRGPLPKDGEVWSCAVVQDTQPDYPRKGALIVRLDRLVEDAAPGGGSEDILNFLRQFKSVDFSDGGRHWAKTLGIYLSKKGLQGAQTVVFRNNLFVLKGDKFASARPFYFESSAGGSSPCKWRVDLLEDPAEDQPPQIRKILEERRIRREVERADSTRVSQIWHAQLARAEGVFRAFGLGYAPVPPMAGRFFSSDDGKGGISANAVELASLKEDDPYFIEVVGRDEVKFVPARCAVWASVREDGYTPTAEDIGAFAAWQAAEAQEAAALPAARTEAERLRKELDATESRFSSFVEQDMRSVVYNHRTALYGFNRVAALGEWCAETRRLIELIQTGGNARLDQIAAEEQAEMLVLATIAVVAPDMDLARLRMIRELAEAAQAKRGSVKGALMILYEAQNGFEYREQRRLLATSLPELVNINSVVNWGKETFPVGLRGAVAWLRAKASQVAPVQAVPPMPTAPVGQKVEVKSLDLSGLFGGAVNIRKK